MASTQETEKWKSLVHLHFNNKLATQHKLLLCKVLCILWHVIWILGSWIACIHGLDAKWEVSDGTIFMCCFPFFPEEGDGSLHINSITREGALGGNRSFLPVTTLSDSLICVVTESESWWKSCKSACVLQFFVCTTLISRQDELKPLHVWLKPFSPD